MEKIQNRNTRYVSSIITESGVIEMVYDDKIQKTKFAILENGKVIYKSGVNINGVKFAPLDPLNDLVRKKVVLFPSEAKDYTTETELVEEIQSFINKYLDISKAYERIASYYVLFTWVYEQSRELPYLRAIGDWGSGKTRFLQVIGSLCYKPIFAGGATTVSPIFRILDEYRGTLVFDEADLRFSDATADIVKILNNGYAKGFPVLRTEGQKQFEVKTYNVFSPKIIATRYSFQDKALESRFLVEEMGTKKMREDIPLTLPDSFEDEALQIRNKLLFWRLQNYGRKIIVNYDLDRSLEPRLNQILIPLLNIITSEEDKNSLKQFVKDYNGQLTSDRGMALEVDILVILLKIYEAGCATPTIKEITDIYNAPFSDLKEKITSKKVGRLMREALKLKTKREGVGFVVPFADNKSKLERLREKHKITDDNLKSQLDDLVNDVNKVNVSTDADKQKSDTNNLFTENPF